MLKKIIALSILTFFFSCKNKSINKSKLDEQKISKIDTMQDILQKVINNKRLDIFLNYLTEEERKKIVLIENRKLGITKNTKIMKFNNRLKVIPIDSIKKVSYDLILKTKNANYLYIRVLKKYKDSFCIGCYYKYENIDLETWFIKKNNHYRRGRTRLARY